MLHITTEKEEEMDEIIPIGTLVLTLLNLGLVIIALATLKGLRKDLRTPVVKKFNPDFKRKSVDIPKVPENFGKKDRDDRQKNRSKNNQQQNRQVAARRPVQKAPDVYSNELPAAPAGVSAPVPPRPVSTDFAPAAEGRRPLPPRSAGTFQTDLAPPAPAAVSYAANDIEESGMEFDRSKIAHGRRNMVAKPVIEDDTEENA
uniref:Uncharacterized protein n=1 Tax=uncultured bacterium contig00069 TaxID=1181550 RepID=A0A806KLL8_9BACT|nr:hypothetical protein [uncultured bacterium contig00069]